MSNNELNQETQIPDSDLSPFIHPELLKGRFLHSMLKDKIAKEVSLVDAFYDHTIYEQNGVFNDDDAVDATIARDKK